VGSVSVGVLPTTTPSASAATCATCARVEMPKPTATGSFVRARMRATAEGMFAAESARTPVTPSRET